MGATETVEVRGHIVDSLILAKILDLIVDAGAEYRVLDLDLGTSHVDPSVARISITAADAAALAGAAAGREAAGRTASANGGRLVTYQELGDDTRVQVELGGVRATARARRTTGARARAPAGPAPRPTLRSQPLRLP